MSLFKKVIINTDDLQTTRAGTDYLRVCWSAHATGRVFELKKRYILRRPDGTKFTVVAVSEKNGETLLVDVEDIAMTRYARYENAEHALLEMPDAPIRSNVVETSEKRVVTFKPKPDNMYGKRSLPENAFKALLIICRCSERLQKSEDTATSTRNFDFHYTVNQAVKALEDGTGYGSTERRAYLPPIIRHLMVQVWRNKKDPLPVVEAFLSNKRFMQMLDDAWKNRTTEDENDEPEVDGPYCPLPKEVDEDGPVVVIPETKVVGEKDAKHIVAKLSGVKATDTKLEAAEKVIATMKAAGMSTKAAERLLRKAKENAH